LQASRDSDEQEILRVCTETLEWLAREMTSPSGGFYSTLDADSDGEEGKFYVWSEGELRALLGEDANALIEYWGVTPEGNFEGHNILHVTHETPPRVLRGDPKRSLYDARSKRVWPSRDEKILASWNGLMLRAVAEAARVLRVERYRDLALRNGEFLFRELVRDGRVFRSHKDGVTRIAGFLEDHAALALGALALYELTFERAWLDRARGLAEEIMRWFWDDDAGAFFDTASDQEALLTRPRDVTDNATPSGTSLTVELLLRLGDVLGDADLVRRANGVLETMAEPMARYPLAFGHALTAADMAVYGAVEAAIVGERGARDFEHLVLAVNQPYVPSLVLAGGVPPEAAGIALLDHREMLGGHATAYVCRGYVCERPVTDPRELAQQLTRAIRSETRP
jgi:uncharacterized protein YyaL (SSP411 family)